MTSFIKSAGFIFLISLSSSILRANTNDAHDSAACKNVRKACEDAGFVVGQVNVDNGVWVNCLKPLKNGKNVKNIKLTDALKKDVKACADAESKSQGRRTIDPLTTEKVALRREEEQARLKAELDAAEAANGLSSANEAQPLTDESATPVFADSVKNEPSSALEVAKAA